MLCFFRTRFTGVCFLHNSRKMSSGERFIDYLGDCMEQDSNVSLVGIGSRKHVASEDLIINFILNSTREAAKPDESFHFWKYVRNAQLITVYCCELGVIELPYHVGAYQ